MLFKVMSTYYLASPVSLLPFGTQRLGLRDLLPRGAMPPPPHPLREQREAGLALAEALPELTSPAALKDPRGGGFAARCPGRAQTVTGNSEAPPAARSPERLHVLCSVQQTLLTQLLCEKRTRCRAVVCVSCQSSHVALPTELLRNTFITVPGRAHSLKQIL